MQANELDLLFNAMNYNLQQDEMFCTINEQTREILVPDNYSLAGVESDEKAKSIKFQCKRQVEENVDLLAYSLRIVFRNANGEEDAYMVTDVNESEDGILSFSWLLSRKVTKYKGSVRFIVCAIQTDVLGNITSEWNTTLATLNVLEGLEADIQVDEQTKDIIEQLLHLVETETTQAVLNVNNAGQNQISKVNVAGSSQVTAVKTEGANQVKEIVKKGEETLQTIPEDYSTLDAEIKKAREGYFGKTYDSLEERIDGDINAIIDKVDTANYKDTSIHATNTYARNLTANGNKVEILGQTIQNCIDHSSTDKFDILNGTIDEDGYISITANGNYRNFFVKKESIILKPNTAYTFVVDVKEYSLVTESNIATFGETQSGQTYFTSSKSFTLENPLNVGINKFVLKTKENFEETIALADRGLISPSATSGTIKFRYAIIEGDWTEKEVSFVPFGLNTPASTEVKMCGKNLLELKALSSINGAKYEILEEDGSRIQVSGQKEYSYLKIDLPHFADGLKRKYKYSGYEQIGDQTGIPGVKLVYLYNGKYYYITIHPDEVETLTIPIGATFVHLMLNVNNSPQALSSETTYIFKDLMVQFTDDFTEFTPYTGNTVTIPHSLGSVSDTVRDKVYLKDGKAYYEQNVDTYEISRVDSVELDTYVHSVPELMFARVSWTLVGNMKCDKLIPTSFNTLKTNKTLYGIAYKTAGNPDLWGIVLRINEIEQTLESYNDYLSKNPITVVYEKGIPITTEISIEDFYSYAEQTNWYTTNTVKPTIDVDIPSNLTALVSNLMVENSALQKENTALSAQVEQQTAEIENQKATNDMLTECVLEMSTMVYG